MSEKYNLTPVEFELMDILWKIGQGTVRDVMSQLSASRDLAYTSVSTILRILEQKGILSAKKSNQKRHIYSPIFSKEKFAQHSVSKIVDQVFSGNSVELVAYLMNKNITIDEITAIQKLLNSKKKELAS